MLCVFVLQCLRAFFSFDYDKYLALLNYLPCVDSYFFNRAIEGRDQIVLHFHSF